VEQGPQAKNIAPPYKVLWHQEIKRDFSRASHSDVRNIVKTAERRLSLAPQLIGQPLKGTTSLLWKIRFGKYRVVYTLNQRKKEVWVLSVQGRDEVYRHSHVQSLLKLAVALHEQMERGGADE